MIQTAIHLPTPVEALCFDGSQESGREALRFLLRNTSIEVATELPITEDDLLNYDAELGIVSFKGRSGMKHLTPGDWLVSDGGRFKIMSDVRFRAFYQIT
jgi:hypothetical protein